MKRFKPDRLGWFCGWWNKAPVQINCDDRKELYPNEALHYHKDFYEYYYVIRGHLILEVNGKRVKVSEDELVAVEPMEKHQVVELSEGGCKYLVVQSKAYKGNKIRVDM